jgi:hypothetical protein
LSASQHHVADAGDGGPEVGEAVRSGEQRAQDRAGPAGADQLDPCVEPGADRMNIARQAGLTYDENDGNRRGVSLRRDDLNERFPGLITLLEHEARERGDP